jgi:glycosyltransferase involved in cell wall biosynthesis
MAVYTRPDARMIDALPSRLSGADRAERSELERTSIVVPAYNEADRIDGSLADFLDWIRPARDVEVIVVDDGSTDATAAIARRRLASLPSSRVVRQNHRGKGAAVRRGVVEAGRDNVLFMDADLATDLDAIPLAVQLLDEHHVVVGSRRLQPELAKGMTKSRQLMNYGFHSLVRGVTGVDVTDSQCGFKAFRATVARYLFPQVRTEGFAFDVEVLALAGELGYAVWEQPVHWVAKSGSKVRPVRDAALMTLDLVRIGRRIRRGRASGPVELEP